MTTTQSSIRFGPATRRQIDELGAGGWGTITNIVSTAIDRMYQQEIKTMTTKPNYNHDSITRLAYEVYQEAYKPYGEANPDRVGEIEEWLRAGDLDDNPDVTQLAAEWLDLETE